MKIPNRNHLIFSLDVIEKNDALKLAKIVARYVDAIKINYPIVLANGLSIIEEIKRITDFPIIADFKVADVPITARKILDLTFNAGADAIMVHGFVGPDIAKDCVDFARKREKGIFFVTELTSPGGAVFTQLIADDVARMAKNLHATGVQAPGTRPHRIRTIRQIVGDELIIISCGIGAQGGQVGSAISAGADYEMIGRMIYNSTDPAGVARKISDKLKKLKNPS